VRPLTDNFETALAAGARRPDYRILAWAPRVDSFGAIIDGSYTHEPYDLTPYCTDISWNPAQLSFTLADPEALFHPDTGSCRQFLADGAIIRLREGDSRVSEDDWVWTFTGSIRGQCGWRQSRRSKVLESKITVFSRDNSQSYKRRSIVSKEYTAGSDIGVMLGDLCETFLGLTAAELRLPSVLGLQFKHKTNQVAGIAPWEAVTALLQTVGGVPFFDGDGRLAYYSKDLSRNAVRRLPDYLKVFDYEIPARNQDDINRVQVTFLDSVLEEVDGPYQKLGSAQVTTGFFSMGEKLECWWSEDHKQRAKNTQLRVIKSVNSGLLPVGSESYLEIDVFHGVITVEIAVWVPSLVLMLVSGYVGGQMINVDLVIVTPTGPCPTIPIGRLASAISLMGIMLIMMCLGSAQYEIWGVPYDMAYLEKRAIAIVDGLEYWEENEKKIENDFIGTQEQADAVAMLELTWEQSLARPRRLVMEDDLALEPGDIVLLPDGRKFAITNLAKTIKRGEVPILTLDGFKVLRA